MVRLRNAEVYGRTFPIGALRLAVEGVRLAPGGHVTATMRPTRGAAKGGILVVTLATAPDEYGKRQAFRVRLDGKEVFSAAERDSGGGFTRSICFDLPEARTALRVEVAAASTSDVPITVSAVRWYSDGAEPLSRDDLRMGLALLTSQGYGYAIDTATMAAMMRIQPHSPNLAPQLALVYNFCTRDSTTNAMEIGRLAQMAEETGVPLRIAFQMHWGGIPYNVPDGSGGKFTDPKYQMVTYDAADSTDDPGLAELLGSRYDIRYGLSVPNIWSDNPWLTFNHPRLNDFRRARLHDVLAAWHAARKRLAQSGRDSLLPPQLSTGEETVYWAKGVDDSKYTKLNHGKPRNDLMSDFNPVTVAEALRDGVTLDPRDGLSYAERWWLHQNMARWQQTIADWMIEASPPDPVLVRRGKTIFAGDLVRRNVYTEPYGQTLYPMMDISPFHPGLELGFVRDGRSGAEYWSGSTMLHWLQKERERGRIALPNLECTVTDEGPLVACLRAAYAFGARFITVYNWHPRANAKELLGRFADSIDQRPGMWWKPEKSVVNSQKSERVYFAPDNAFGVNRVVLYPAQFQRPASLRLTLKEDDVTDGAEVAVTGELGALRAEDMSVAIDLPTFFLQTPGRRYALVVEGTGEGFTLARAADGWIAARLESDLIGERRRSLLIEERQDAVDLIASLKRRHDGTLQSPYAAEALAEAEKLLESGESREAYRAGIKCEQISLPAAYELESPGGRLDPYPVTIRCQDGPVTATITSCDGRTATLMLRSPITQSITARLGGHAMSVILSINEPKELVLKSLR
ncbi:MAG: hypothetical protein AB1428_09575 [Bacteroidota bacterium]